MSTKKQRIKHFICKTAIKIFIFTIFMGIIAYLINLPIFTNEMAMNQLQSDDYSYVAWDTFIHLRNLFNSFDDFVIGFFIGTIIFDIYNFIKHNKGEN